MVQVNRFFIMETMVGQLDFYRGEEPQNYDQKCPVVFVIDRSGSMSGTPINECNKGLKAFETEVPKDATCKARLDIAVVSFGSDTVIERDFGLIEQASMPQLSISGSTKMVDALNVGIDMLDKRKKWYHETGQNYYRPYLILITDGAPDSDQDVQGVAVRLKVLASGKHINFWPIAVQGANMSVMQQLSTYVKDNEGGNGSLPPMMLDGLEFVKLFKFLSNSFTKITNSKLGDKTDFTPKDNENPFVFNV
jgi:uncharacterized protein YegL